MEFVCFIQALSYIPATNYCPSRRAFDPLGHRFDTRLVRAWVSFLDLPTGMTLPIILTASAAREWAYPWYSLVRILQRCFSIVADSK